MKPTISLSLLLTLSAPALSQTAVSIFPADYIDVSEGPANSPNIPLAQGVSRVQIVYEAADLPIPSGRTITRIGFRQDATLTAMDTGRTTNLEIQMGYTTATAANIGTNLNNNYAAPPVTVLGPANIVLPNLRDANNPLPNGMVWIDLTTPFQYLPAGRNLVVEFRCFGNSGGGSAWNYRLDRADFHSPITYGPVGCPHAGGGTPSLTLQPTRPGLSFSASITQGPAFAFSFLLLEPGAQLPTTPLSLAGLVPGINPACTLQLNLANALQMTGTTNGSGSLGLSFPIPNNNIWGHFDWTCQAAFLDLFAPGLVCVSRGAQIRVGMRPRSTAIVGTGNPLTVTTGTANRNYCPVTFFQHQ